MRRLELLTAPELEGLPRQRTLIFFPVGILEDHGPHLPLGSDLLTAQQLAERLALAWEEKNPGWEVILAPSAPLGVNGNTRKISLEIRGHVLRDWLVDACFSLGTLGFQFFGAISGTFTPRQLTAIEEASEILYRRTGRMRILPRPTPPLHLAALSSTWIPPRTWEASPLWPDPAEHGGAEDTALAQALTPQAVRTYDEKEWPTPDPRPARRWDRWLARFRRESRGFWGNPLEADVPKAQQKIQDWVHDCQIKLLAMTSGSPGFRLFRSGYGLFPPNRSLFAAWMLGLISLILLTLTFSMSLPDLSDLNPQ